MSRRIARVANPVRRRRTARVVNPFDVMDAMENTDGELEDVTDIFEEFSGRRSEFVTDYEVGPDVPRTLAELGGLLEIETDDGTVYEFDSNDFRLCADAQGNLHIAGPREIDDEMPVGERVLLGEVIRCDYIADKPHLYPDDEEQEFTHTFGDDEEGAQGPELSYEDGYLLLDPETGDYEVLPEGIQDTEPGRVRNGFFSSLADKAVGTRWEVEALAMQDPMPTIIGTYRTRTKKEALRLAKEQARKELPPGSYTRFKATRA